MFQAFREDLDLESDPPDELQKNNSVKQRVFRSTRIVSGMLTDFSRPGSRASEVRSVVSYRSVLSTFPASRGRGSRHAMTCA
jgi:hypothetical protein